MPESNVISVAVRGTPEVDIDGTDLQTVITQLQQVLELAQAQGLSNVVIQADSDYDSSWVSVEFIGRRPETQQETEARFLREHRSREFVEQRELREFERLKAKFMPQ